jgi:hypothetical protein
MSLVLSACELLIREIRIIYCFYTSSTALTQPSFSGLLVT